MQKKVDQARQPRPPAKSLLETEAGLWINPPHRLSFALRFRIPIGYNFFLILRTNKSLRSMENKREYISVALGRRLPF